MFHMNGRDLACRLGEVREVVRAVGIDPLPGTRAPVSGVLELRNDPLPVVDLRSDAYPGEAGDVLVLNPGPGGSYGVAVVGGQPLENQRPDAKPCKEHPGVCSHIAFLDAAG